MTISFHSLGLSENRVHKLETLGFTTPTEIQCKAIPLILEGHDILGQSQTGTGKTAAYSLPIMEQIDTNNSNIQALVLTPTRELAQQVALALKDFSTERQLYILTVYGGQSIEKQIRSLQRGVQIVVGTPGRVIDLLDRKKLVLNNLKWAVLDEADEMLSMGFIDDVKKILRQTPDQRNTACFSATMPREIRELVNQFLKSPVTVTIDQPQAAPDKIEQHLYGVPRGWSKLKALQPILEIEIPDTAIVFVRTKQTASELTSKLQEAGQSVDEYHGNLSQSQRERLVHRFREGKVRIVVATDIAARGLDVENLSHVINYDLPDNAETYIHRIGRTGRAGKKGTAISLVEPIDRRMIRQIERRIRQKIELCSIPNRSQVEAKRLEKLQRQIQDSLAGERMASFLPIVRELSDEYDPQAIAAAALQMVYDQDCPKWMRTDWEVPEAGISKPIIQGNNRKDNSKPRRNNSGKKSDRKTIGHHRGR
ncbi:DEAD/DEAH box helicase [cyanobacterium endosymbiont of Epithemia turgida]|uniref:DEAD/DEAH box helicase n=1 Tax=cyanobacterium endosymbiont of Epithemia turgida TaxID=718217 RepID=UPI0004D0BEF3|nr:DEAD/DEAH box helicase [cyanobacterium endosymbiont of Epithemia turgida]BAP18357.1 ATP-dependent RNA helicase [cyanobacterium endosymbiont of Epithemia turgida isolate EtSB Lake Yunoko]